MTAMTKCACHDECPCRGQRTAIQIANDERDLVRGGMVPVLGFDELRCLLRMSAGTFGNALRAGRLPPGVNLGTEKSPHLRWSTSAVLSWLEAATLKDAP